MKQPKKIPVSVDRARELKLKFYNDEKCTEALQLGFPKPTVTGHEAVMKAYVKNVTGEKLYDLKFECKDMDLRIEAEDNKIMPYGVLEIKFVFTPNRKRTESLVSSFIVTGNALCHRRDLHRKVEKLENIDDVINEIKEEIEK